MLKFNIDTIKASLITAMLNNSPVKLKFKKSKNFDSYFGKIIEINDFNFVIEYHDTLDTVEFSEIDNFIN